MKIGGFFPINLYILVIAFLVFSLSILSQDFPIERHFSRNSIICFS